MKRLDRAKKWYSECFTSASPILTPISGGVAMMVSPKQLLSVALGVGTVLDAKSNDNPIQPAMPRGQSILRRRNDPEEIYVYSSDDMIDLVIRNYGSVPLSEDLDPRIVDFLGSVFEAVMQRPYEYIDTSVTGDDGLCIIKHL